MLIVIYLLYILSNCLVLFTSIVRAVTMFSAIAISMTVKQSISTYKALIISIFVLLLFNPFYLFNVGFQLSYLAVFFIVWTQPMLYKLWKPKLKLFDYAWRLLTVSVAAQVGVLPLSLYYFHQFPGLFFLTNLIIIPFLGIILGMGVLVIGLALLNILPGIIAKLYSAIILALNSVVEWVANKESFLFQNISFSEISIVIYFLMIVSFFKWLEIKQVRFLKLSLLALILFQLNLIFEKYSSDSINEFLIFNKTRESILGIRKGQGVQLNHSLGTIGIDKESAIKAYFIGSNTNLTSSNNKINNVFSFHDKNILVIDNLGIFNLENYSANYVLLRQSPNINLVRLIKELNPELIIADASNYRSHIALWEKTCKNYNIKFHYTVTDGAFIERF